MLIKNIIEEDFINYKKSSMFIITSICSFKCEKDCGIRGLCQNNSLTSLPSLNIQNINIVNKYLNNTITEAIVFGGLEPLDQFDELVALISCFRKMTEDDLVIYTGYNKEEIMDKIEQLKKYKNIIIKFGRYIPNQQPHHDKILGVDLASNNQYAERIS